MYIHLQTVVKICFVMLLLVTTIACSRNSNASSKQAKKMRCLNPPSTTQKVEITIKECQEEVKTKIVQEAFRILHEKFEEGHDEGLVPYTSLYDGGYDHSRHRRSSHYHPTMVSWEDKRIAGCLLHCVYAKNNAIDKLGWPTLDGLVQFYTDGANDHAFFMATLRAANGCLKAIAGRYGIDRSELPKHGESCDLAFDIFDCISDQITEHCFEMYSP